MRLDATFYHRPCLDVARDLVGKVIVRTTPQGELRLRITETEAYGGEWDTACHASRGRTPRTQVFYMEAGTIYVYLCYGIHWLLNIVTGDLGDPQAVLIRACSQAPGPGRLTKRLGITGAYNRQSILQTADLWIEDDGWSGGIITAPRVGIGYAAQEDQDRLWRFVMQD